MNQTVTKPHRLENSRLFGENGRIYKCIDIGEAEKHAAVGQANAPFDGQVSHVLTTTDSVRKTDSACQANRCKVPLDTHERQEILINDFLVEVNVWVESDSAREFPLRGRYAVPSE